MKIAIFPNMDKFGVVDITLNAVKQLQAKNVDVFLPKGIDFLDCPKQCEEELYKNCDVIITVGGDGTLINYAKAASAFSKPVLGINAGRLGYLADVDNNELSLLDKLTTYDYSIDSRIMLNVEIIKNGEKIFSGTALNDIVLGSGGITKISDINLNILGDDINYHADGIILSTPTGSTAYSMSAGGPIVEPSARCFIITPICSHSMTARPLIVNQENIITLSVSDSDSSSCLTVDGRDKIPVDNKCKIIITKSVYEAKFINLSGRTFYKTLSYKF